MRFQGGRKSYQYRAVQTGFKYELSVFVATGQSRQDFYTDHNGWIFRRRHPTGGPLRCWNDPKICVTLPVVPRRCHVYYWKKVVSVCRGAVPILSSYYHILGDADADLSALVRRLGALTRGDYIISLVRFPFPFPAPCRVLLPPACQYCSPPFRPTDRNIGAGT